MKELIKHPVYIGVVFFVIMPLNGAIIQRGDTLIGLILMATQALWFFGSVVSKTESQNPTKEGDQP